MRVGRISEESNRILQSLSRTPIYPNDGLEPTELFPLRHQVESSNSIRLSQLPGTTYSFDAIDSSPTDYGFKLLENTMAPKRLELKLNTQVMLIKNLDRDKVNGSVGKIVGWGEVIRNEIGLMVEVPEIVKDVNGKVIKEIWYPRVRFLNALSDFVIRPVEFTVSLPKSKSVYQKESAIEPCRRQIPLVLAWAM